MKKFYHLLFFTIITGLAAAQQYGNEWISYGQKYYRFSVITDGVYRIDSLALASSGINVSAIDPRKMQVFGRGQEIPLYNPGEADGVFNTADYIEFYAQRNDGFLDSLMYDTASNPNPYYSLINDTAYYFFTWNNSLNNLRMADIIDTSFSLHTPVNYFMRDQVITRPYEYQYGNTSSIGSRDVQYVQSEGWTDNAFQFGIDPNSYTFNTAQRYPAGPPSILKFSVVGVSRDFSTTAVDHELRVEFLNQSSSYVQLIDTLFKGYKQVQRSFSIPTSTNIGSNTDVRITNVNNLSFNTNPYMAVGYVRLKFPHIYDLENQSSFMMYIPDNPNLGDTLSYLNISNFNSNSSTVFLYDLSNKKRFRVYPNGSNFRVLVRNSSGEKKCFLTSNSQVTNITSLSPVTPSAQFTNFSTVSFDSAFIIVTHKTLMSAAQQYGLYRSSNPFGGNHNVVLADVNELYDQFAYGIRRHPLSIRRFAKFAINSALVSPPRNLFLIGKAISSEQCRTSPTLSAANLVPTMGYPPTDNYLTAGLTNNMIVTGIATGRLAAKTPQEVTDYLLKIQDYEDDTSPQEWMKHVIHFGGGSNQSEQWTFQSYLSTYKAIIKGPYYGAFVHDFFKNSSQPIQLTISDSVRRLINGGVSLMTFFGHASGNSFDQNIDYASNYNNTGKYPLVLANSCFTGDIHQPIGYSQSSTSEDWVLIPNKGAIGFIASIAKTNSGSLYYYSLAFYNNLSQLSYNRSVGYCMQQSVVSTQNLLDDEINTTCLQMSLHGDPSLRIHTWSKPDYSIADSSIYFSPRVVTTAIDSFDVKVVITNLGKAQNDTVDVGLKRTFPNGSFVSYSKSRPNIRFRDTVSFRLPVDKILGPGLNKFEVQVDPFQKIPELSELNNDVTSPSYIPLVIASGDIVPIYPYNYAIVPFDTVTLKASTGDPFAAAANYEIEIDTTDLYNSPLLVRTTLNNMPGGVISWKPPLTLLDSTVYFWHVRRMPASSRSSGWKEFSFQFIRNKRGWEQAHFFQFKNDNFAFLNYNRNQRTFDFIATGKTLTCNDYGQRLPSYNLTQLYATEYKLDLDIEEYAGCALNPSMNVAIIDPITLQPWGNRWFNSQNSVTYNPTHFFGNANDNIAYPSGPCGRNRVENYFVFRFSSAAELQGMRNMIRNAVPNGYYVLMYTWLQGRFRSWADSTVRDYLRDSLGAAAISSLPDTIPYIFYCKKGSPPTATEVIGTNAAQYINLITNLTNNSNYGTIVSPLLGPALSWDSLSWKAVSLENPTRDTARLDIIGVSAAGVETTVRSGLLADSSNIYLNNISAVTYPYLKLKARLNDDSLLTAPQLKKWQIFYQPAPEVAVNPPVYFSFKSDTVQEGDSIKFKVAVTNVSEFNIDSMLVTYWVVDRNRVTHYLPSYMSKPLAAGNSLTTSITFSTYGYPGLNSVWMEINPLGTAKTKHEQYHFNNIAQVGFFAGADKINPLLDVTFDGVHILNGDIVSAKPNILIRLKDENKFLALNDTAGFKIYLKKPSQQTSQLVYFYPNCSGLLCFTPAVLPDNSCKINYTPVLTEDGIYEMIVQSKDRSANLSGNIDYRITFEVVNKPSITEVLNYPNPFSTSTKFVFTLTGSEVPDFRIQIFTITGKVVREISRDELGSIHIGRNITDYAWDGKDDFGDQLANGVYFYRVLTQLNGSDMEKRSTNADQYFKKGFGKMYLMR